MIVAASQISTNETRKGAFKAIYDRRKADQEKMTQLLQPGTAGGAEGGGRDVGRGGGIRGNIRGGTNIRGGGGGRGEGRSGASPVPIPGGPGFDPAEQDKADAEAYVDPLFPGETVLNDWELTVLLAVVLDPKKPEAPPAGETPAAPTENQPATPAPAEASAKPTDVKTEDAQNPESAAANR
jgi:hypothetical protein